MLRLSSGKTHPPPFSEGDKGGQNGYIPNVNYLTLRKQALSAKTKLLKMLKVQSKLVYQHMGISPTTHYRMLIAPFVELRTWIQFKVTSRVSFYPDCIEPDEYIFVRLVSENGGCEIKVEGGSSREMWIG